MKKKIFGIGIASAVIMLFNMIACAEAIQVGEYLQMGSYYGEPILWRCVDINENGHLMLSDKIICLKTFDARGNNVTGSHKYGEQYFNIPNNRAFYGSNYWGDSNIRSWLNSEAPAGEVEWLCGNPPIDVYFDFEGSRYDIKNPYDKEAGFLTNFSDAEKSVIKEVVQKSIVGREDYKNGVYDTGTEAYNFNYNEIGNSNYDTAYAKYFSDKMFLLDEPQFNALYKNSGVLGEDYYIGVPTLSCSEKCDFGNTNFSYGQTWGYLLRIPSSLGIIYVEKDGSLLSRSGADNLGIRPGFYIDLSSSNLSGRGTAAEPYIIQEKKACFKIDGNTVTNLSDKTQKPVVIVANYTGRTLDSVKKYDESFAAGETKNYPYGDNTKIFVWDSLNGMCPLVQ